MGLLKSLKGLLRRDTEPDESWEVRHRLQQDGVEYYWSSQHQEKPLLDPSPELGASEPERIMRTTLRLLEQEEVLQRNGILPFEEIGKFDHEELQILRLAYSHDWKLGVRPTKALGRLNPQLVGEWHAPDGTYFDKHETDRFRAVPCGYVDTKRKELHILPPGFLKVRQKLEEQPTFSKVSEEYHFLAEIQEAVENTADFLREYSASRPVTLDEQLKRERYIVPQAHQVKLEARNTEDGGVEIRPTMPGFETFEAAGELVKGSAEITPIWRSPNNDLGRERIAFDEAVTQRINVARVLNKVSPAEKESFEKDPLTFAQNRLDQRPEFKDMPFEVLDEMEFGEAVEALIEAGWDREPTAPFEAIPRKLQSPEPAVPEPAVPEPTVPEPAELELPEPVEDEPAPPRSSPELINRVEGEGTPEPIEYGPREWREAPNLLDGVEPLEVPRLVKEPVPTPNLPSVLLTKDNDEEVRFAAEASQRLREELSRFPISKSFRGTLHPHQEEGHIWLRNLWHVAQDAAAGQGGLLADEMGLGKTVQVAALLAHLADEGRLKQTLIVVPGAVLENWEKELIRFVSTKMRIHLHHGPSRPRRLNLLNDYDVIVVPNETLARDQRVFAQIKFNTLIVDEAHLIKNYSTLRARAVRAMNARLRIALTATPVENRLEELWSIVDFAQPGLLGSLRDYKKAYVQPIETNLNAQGAARNLLTILQPHYLRRTKSVLPNLPPKHVHVVELPMTAVQEQIYDTVRSGLRGAGARGLGIIHTLARTSAHPGATPVDAHPATASTIQSILSDPESLISSSPKFQFIIDKLKEIKEAKEKAIIFTSAKIVQPLLIRAIQHSFGIEPRCVSGDEKMGNRPRILEEFDTAVGFGVIILSPQTVGLGVNITGANHVFHLTREWNPSKEDQATDRVYRIGQTRPVHVYVPIVKHSKVLSVDERLHQLMDEKGRLTRSVIRPSGDLKISDEDFMVCLRDQPKEEAIFDIVVLDIADQAAAREIRQNRTGPLPAVLPQEHSVEKLLGEIFKNEHIRTRMKAEELEPEQFWELILTVKDGPRHADQIARELNLPPNSITALMANVKRVLNLDGFPVLLEDRKTPKANVDTEGVDFTARRIWYSLSTEGLKKLQQTVATQERSLEDMAIEVFRKLKDYGFLTEDDVTRILGTPRRQRQFTSQLETLSKRFGMMVKIEENNGGKLFRAEI